jgi:hypothetical protein
MLVHEVAIAKTLVAHAAPEYVWDYVHALTAHQRRLVLTEDICSSIEARDHPVLDLVLAAYGDSDAHARMAKKSDALATVAMASPGVDVYSAHRSFAELPKDAQVAIGQNPEFGCGRFYEDIIKGRDGYRFEPEMVENVLRGLIDNPWVKAGGHTKETNSEGRTFQAIDFKDFIWTIFEDLRKGARATERAWIYAAILDACPSVWLTSDKLAGIGTMLDEIADNIKDQTTAYGTIQVRDEVLEAISAALARNIGGTREPYDSLLSHARDPVRAGFYRGVREITKPNVRDWNKKDGALFVQSVFRNPALYKLDLSDAQDFVERRLAAIDPLLANSFRHVAEIHRNDANGYKNGYLPEFERGIPNA